MNWWNRLRGERQLEIELDAELRYHFDRVVADGMRHGLSQEEAHRQARLQLGGTEQAKEQCRDARGTLWVESLSQDVRFAVRQLSANRGFAVVAVLALALGIGANAAVFTVVRSILLKPLALPDSERLFLAANVELRNAFGMPPTLSLIDRDYLAYRDAQHSFEDVAAFRSIDVSLQADGEPVRTACAQVSPNFFQVVKEKAALGRTFVPEDAAPGHTPVLVLSDSLWRSRFQSDPAILGKVHRVDDEQRTVIGVMSPGFQFPYDAEFWNPEAIVSRKGLAFYWPVIGLLKPGVTREQADAELHALALSMPRGQKAKPSQMLTAVLPVNEMFGGEARQALLVFSVAVGFVLLIACANIANLLLMRAAVRSREVALRAALGAGRARLLRQFLTESLVVAFAGGATGMALCAGATPALLAMAPKGMIPRIHEIHVDGWALAFACALSVLTGLVFGLLPALEATNLALRESLSEGGRNLTARRRNVRGALVAAEIALALVLLAGAGLLLKSFVQLRGAALGFRPDNLAAATIDAPSSIYRTADQLRQVDERILDGIRNLPGVSEAAAVNWAPLAGALTIGDFHTSDRRPMPKGYMVDKPCITPGYFRTLGVRFLAGRDFNSGDAAGAPGVVIVSASVARTVWPGEDPLGKRLTGEDDPKPDDWLTVVGVVDDVRQQSVAKERRPAIYQPLTQVRRTGWLSHMTFFARTQNDPALLAKAMRQAVYSADRNLPAAEITTMLGAVKKQTAKQLFETRLLAGFALAALLLAALGIYGAVAYSVTERTSEIGIRMALGAARSDVAGMVVRQTLALAAAGVAAGTAGAWALARAMEKTAAAETSNSLIPNLSLSDPAIFSAVAALLTLVALAAGVLPALNAARVDPAVTLRHQ